MSLTLSTYKMSQNWEVDIVLSIDGVRTLVNIFIIDPIRMMQTL